MKRFKAFLLGCLLALTATASTYHIYHTMSSDGSLDKIYSSFNGPNGDPYEITIACCEISANHYIRTTIYFDGPDSEYDVYRVHADGVHRDTDNTDPNWNMALQPTINPVWCSYEYYSAHGWGSICWTDTFDSALLTNELSTVNTLRYRVYDITNNHTFEILIINAMYYATNPDHGIITGTGAVNDIKVGDQVIYYNLQGLRSNTPFDGINIVKCGTTTKKVIY